MSLTEEQPAELNNNSHLNDTGETKESSSEKKKKKTLKEKEWSDEEIMLLIETFEANPCLWDMDDATYSKRDVKELTWSNISKNLKTPISSIRSKMNTLRAQLSREVNKEQASQSGQSADELYYSTWTHYDKMKFLIPMLKVSKSRDTMKRKPTDGESSDVESDSCPPTKKKVSPRKNLNF